MITAEQFAFAVRDDCFRAMERIASDPDHYSSLIAIVTKVGTFVVDDFRSSGRWSLRELDLHGGAISRGQHYRILLNHNEKDMAHEVKTLNRTLEKIIRELPPVIAI